MPFAVTTSKGVKRVTDYLFQHHHELSQSFWQKTAVKGSGALPENQSNCMRYSIILKKFAKRA
jgi:hypothetical protein